MKKHPDITRYSAGEQIYALTGPRTSENWILEEHDSSVDGVPVAIPEASKKRQMADAAPTPSVKRIKLSVSPKAEPKHLEHAAYMAQKAARKEAKAQEHEPDFETTFQAIMMLMKKLSGCDLHPRSLRRLRI